MIRIYISICILALHCCIYAQNSDLKVIADKITIESIKDKVYFLASDSLKGRKTYEKGQKDAANYISDAFKLFHINQLNGADGYYQKFTRYKLKSCFSPIRKNGKFLTSFYFSNSPIKDTSEIKFVFAGRANDNDLQNLNLENKAIVFFVDSLNEGIKKVNELSRKYPGNEFVICMNNKRNIPRFTNFFKQKPIKLDEVKGFKDLKEYHYRLYLNALSKEYADGAELISRKLDSTRIIRLFVIGEEQLGQLFESKAKKLYKKTKKNIRSIDNLLINVPVAVAKRYVNFVEKTDTLTTENVIAYIEGTEKKDEVLIISAHYDHVGKNYKGLCPGADDNASGTAALMEIAKAYSLAKEKGMQPKRSVVFVAFTGEEEGLVGSWHYVNNPLFPLKSTICNINMDMIGRNHKDKEKNATKVFMAGRDKDNRSRKRTFRKIDKQYQLLSLDTRPPLIPRIMWIFGSDQHAFHMKKIPSNIIFTGDHKDYHTPGDTPDKINYEKLTKIAKLVFLSTWELANE